MVDTRKPSLGAEDDINQSEGPSFQSGSPANDQRCDQNTRRTSLGTRRTSLDTKEKEKDYVIDEQNAPKLETFQTKLKFRPPKPTDHPTPRKNYTKKG